MKISKRDIYYGQKLDTIRQEITSAGLSDASDEELLELFSKHAKQLFTLFDESIVKKNRPDLISELRDIFYNSFKEPIFILDADLNIIYKNIPDIRKFENFQKITHLKDLLKGHDYSSLQKKVLDRKVYQLCLFSPVFSLYYNLIIIPFEPINNESFYTMLIFKEREYKSRSNLRILNDTDPVYRNNFEFEIPNLYKKLLDTINGFYFIADHSLNIILVSGTIKEKLGYSSSELIGNPIEIIIPKENNLTFYKQLDDYLLSKIDLKNSKPLKSEIVTLDSKGITSYYEISYNHFFSDKSKDSFLLCTCLDINVEKNIALQLEADRDKAEQSDLLKSEFLSNMSHEIRTPLNGIIGFSEMLDREGITLEKKQKYMRIIRSSTRQLLTLVNDIIDFSKMEAGQLKISCKKTDINKLIDELYLTYYQEIKRSNKFSIVLKKSFGNSNKKIFLYTDDIRMQQVFVNLLNNALKFTDEGEITFGYTISEKEETIRFFVRDTGIGIPQAQQKLIFKRFLQTHEGEKQKYNGTGLGLAISKGIIELMGGDLQVKSKINVGSEFYFTLPLNIIRVI